METAVVIAVDAVLGSATSPSQMEMNGNPIMEDWRILPWLLVIFWYRVAICFLLTGWCCHSPWLHSPLSQQLMAVSLIKWDLLHIWRLAYLNWLSKKFCWLSEYKVILKYFGFIAFFIVCLLLSSFVENTYNADKKFHSSS